MKTIISLFFLFCSLSFVISKKKNPGMITVVGTGKVYSPPDHADVTIGVTMSQPSAENASNQVDKISSDIINYLKQNGVVDHDIQSSYVSVSPGFNFEFLSAPPFDFSAEKTVDFSIRDLSKYDRIVQDLFDFGANTISHSQFQADDIESKMKELRAQATQAAENAKMMGDDLAKSLGYSIGNVFSLEDESVFDHFPTSIGFPALPTIGTNDDNANSSIAGGRITFSSSVKTQFFRGDPFVEGEQTEGKKRKKKLKMRKYRSDA